MSKRYLYGASIQGIQDFIFKTNKLAEIVGASELVEQICTQKFLEVSKLNEDNVAILQIAAGNVKCEFTDEAKLASVVRNFPFEVQKMAPGITISQAVVEIEGDDYLQNLEEKLKVQRNKISKPLEIGFMGLERARRTGDIAFEIIKNEFIDEATYIKKQVTIASSKEFENEKSKETLFRKIAGFDVKNADIAFNIEDITASGENSWIAVIHADGNGLGQILQQKGKEISANNKNKAFSKAIEEATKKAVQRVFKELIEDTKSEWNKDGKYRYPIRPVVLGGDDLTVIIRADLALDFTNKFLRYFEEISKTEFASLKIAGIEGLSACAGIAFVKNSYPLHYALDLAEELCKDAKKKVKDGLKPNEVPLSSLAFYKVQESFISDLDELKKRTLTTKEAWNFYAGPYLLKDVDALIERLSILQQEVNIGNNKTKAVGKLRQIVSESYKDVSTTTFMLERMKEINKDFYIKLKLENDLESLKIKGKSELLDLITLHGFNYGNN